ncbi:MAG TPA: hypothetical protein EYQ05_11715 [Gammaproteobacteria bacterium]|nr:hypothetical protein [Gammaproteobacteria bacterium]
MLDLVGRHWTGASALYPSPISILEKHGDKLLTTNNPDLTDDTDPLNRLGIEPLAPSHLNANGSDHPVL